MSNNDPAGGVLATHLRELPNVALAAALDLIEGQGPEALALVMRDEYSRRRPCRSLPPECR